jgi:hypothetical protein
MNKQPTRGRRGLALAVAVAALVALFGAGQAVAAPAPPDERVLERQGLIERGKAEPSQGSPAAAPRRWFRPEPLPVAPPPQIGDEQVVPAPTAAAPAGGRSGPVVIVAVAALLLAVGAATAWRARNRRPQPESTA